jgi:hypothetical protein
MTAAGPPPVPFHVLVCKKCVRVLHVFGELICCPPHQGQYRSAVETGNLAVDRMNMWSMSDWSRQTECQLEAVAQRREVAASSSLRCRSVPAEAEHIGNVEMETPEVQTSHEHWGLYYS